MAVVPLLSRALKLGESIRPYTSEELAQRPDQIGHSDVTVILYGPNGAPITLIVQTTEGIASVFGSPRLTNIFGYEQKVVELRSLKNYPISAWGMIQYVDAHLSPASADLLATWDRIWLNTFTISDKAAMLEMIFLWGHFPMDRIHRYEDLNWENFGRLELLRRLALMVAYDLGQIYGLNPGTILYSANVGSDPGRYVQFGSPSPIASDYQIPKYNVGIFTLLSLPV